MRTRGVRQFVCEWRLVIVPNWNFDMRGRRAESYGRDAIGQVTGYKIDSSASSLPNDTTGKMALFDAVVE